MDLAKLNNRGGQWNPTPPLPGVTPFLQAPTGALPEYEETVRFVNFRARAVRDDSIPEEKWFTSEDPEWPAALLAGHGVDPDPGPVLRKWIAFTRELHGVTRVEAVCQIVGMDTAWQLCHEITVWAFNDPDVTLAKSIRRVDPDGPDDDIITWMFDLGAHATWRIGDAMDVDFAEKFWWQEWRKVVEGTDGLYGWRPEKIVEHLTGIDCALTTTYGVNGAPAMDNYPQGHSFFWMYMCLRFAQVLNGRGVDKMLMNMALIGGFARVMAFVHDPASVFGGVRLAEEMAQDTSPIWDAVDAAKVAGWPLT